MSTDHSAATPMRACFVSSHRLPSVIEGLSSTSTTTSNLPRAARGDSVVERVVEPTLPFLAMGAAGIWAVGGWEGGA